MDDMFENKNPADEGNSEPAFSEKATENEPESFDAPQQNVEGEAEPVVSGENDTEGAPQQEQPNTDVQPNFSGIFSAAGCAFVSSVLLFSNISSIINSPLPNC